VRPIHRASIVLLVLAFAAVAWPPGVRAAELGSNSLSELSTKAEQEEASSTATTTATTSSSSSSNSSELLVIGAAALVLLAGIVFVVGRDARAAAPAGDGLLGAGGSARDSAARQRKRRAKAKAARAQRKRNR
jgi:hypothetical protein